MYIEIHEQKELKQKALYFKLNNAFNMNIESEENHKIVGLYAIFKDNICLYVGRSTNIASRIATHLRGKYEGSTEVFIWNIENIGFSDFRTRNKQSQKNILDNSEKWLMSKLKPIENLLIDMDFRLEEDKTPHICLEYPACISLNILNNSLRIFDIDFSLIEDIMIDLSFLNHSKIISDSSFAKCAESVKEYDIIHFYNKGFKNE